MLQIFFVTVLILSITSAVNSDNCQVENCPSIAASQAGTPLLPIPSDCTKYVQCDNGFPRTVSCPSGLQFNNNAQVCDWPLNVNCVPCDNSEPNSANSDPTSTTDTNSEIITENSTTQEPSTANNLCVSATSEHYLFPLVTDCTKFISCSNGVPYVMNCPKGLHFNDELSVCDWPASANCTAVITTTTPPISTTDEESFTGTETTRSETAAAQTTAAETTQGPSADYNMCAQATPEHYLFPLVTDCTKFISCSNGVPYVMNCPKGLHFNVVLSVCDWPSSANCIAATTTTTTSTIGTTEAETISAESSAVTETNVTETLVAETTEADTTTAETIALETTSAVSAVTKTAPASSTDAETTVAHTTVADTSTTASPGPVMITEDITTTRYAYTFIT